MNAVTGRLRELPIEQARAGNELQRVLDLIGRSCQGDYARAERSLIDYIRGDADLMWEFFKAYRTRALREALVPRVMPPRPPKPNRKAEGLRSRVVETLREVETKVDYWKKTAAWFEAWVMQDGTPILDATRSKLEAEIRIEDGEAGRHRMRSRLYAILIGKVKKGGTVGDSIPPDELVRIYERVFSALPPREIGV